MKKKMLLLHQKQHCGYFLCFVSLLLILNTKSSSGLVMLQMNVQFPPPTPA